uniref:Uncharacterized protein n=1 Tax=Arundo donax TaxID=35708 RepID=A0A0A9ALK0_ARUDO
MLSPANPCCSLLLLRMDEKRNQERVEIEKERVVVTFSFWRIKSTC